MSIRVALMSAFLMCLGGAAQAEVIHVGKTLKSNQPHIVRGPSDDCDANRPHVIHVRQELSGKTKSAPCPVKTVIARQPNITITNIVVIARDHEHVYIRRHKHIQN